MDNFSDRLRSAMEAAGYTISRLQRDMGISYQAVKKAVEGGRFGAANHLAAARLLGVSPEWLSTGVGPRTGAPQEAHAASQRAWTMDQIRPLLWEELMKLYKADLPPLFQVVAPDDSMAPRLRQGVRATFERDISPQAGDGVLVRDGSGELHIRYYRRGRPGTWEAHAESADYVPLVSDRDSLEVLAVLTAVEGRWS